MFPDDMTFGQRLFTKLRNFFYNLHHPYVLRGVRLSVKCGPSTVAMRTPHHPISKAPFSYKHPKALYASKEFKGVHIRAI